MNLGEAKSLNPFNGIERLLNILAHGYTQLLENPFNGIERIKI